MKLRGWGQFCESESTVLSPCSASDIAAYLKDIPQSSLIARGCGRSYGDSALAGVVLSTRHLDNFIRFDRENGILACGAGVRLDQVLQISVPSGWFLPVVPGTKFVSVGGAIASDVHGKNHHLDGCFSKHVRSLNVWVADKGIIQCSPNENADLFRATCGGMGLTGVIISAEIQLMSIASSTISQKIIQTKDIHETLNVFEESDTFRYSVAWIDTMAKGKGFGRSVLFLGDHSRQGELEVHGSKKLTVPNVFFISPLNNLSIKLFNEVHYRRNKSEDCANVHYDKFFFPLDGLHHWYRLYGRKGFFQYQCLIPDAAGQDAVIKFLQKVQAFNRGSFLSVLKRMGKGNDNYLSFPGSGYTIAMDFKYDKGLFKCLDQFDRFVEDIGGKVYLTKDGRMSKESFRAFYPDWESFAEIRQKYGANTLFNSDQSLRLGL